MDGIKAKKRSLSFLLGATSIVLLGKREKTKKKESYGQRNGCVEEMKDLGY
jgi:hypothetical protein